MSDTLSRARELRAERKKLVEDAGALIAKAREESRDLTSEEHEQWTKLHADADSRLQSAERIEKQSEVEADAARSMGTVVGPRGTGGEERTEKAAEAEERVSEVFERYMRSGIGGLRNEDREVMESRVAQLSPEVRAQSAGTDTAGGFLVPEGFFNQVAEALLQFGGIRSVATVIRTASGNDLPMPTNNDTSNKGAILAENTAASEQDISLGQVVLHAYTYSSKMVKVSRQLLQDSAVDVPSLIARKLGERIGRITAEHFVTGDGNSKPYGIVPMATVGKTAASSTAVTWDELLDLKHSVDPAYRQNARWAFNDSTLLAIKKLVDGEGRPLWQAGVTANEPDRIDGDPYIVLQELADIGASAKPILYGDFSHYYIRDVLGMTLLRLEERYAEAFQVAFLGFSRHDGVLVDAGTHPVKVLANA